MEQTAGRRQGQVLHALEHTVLQIYYPSAVAEYKKKIRLEDPNTIEGVVQQITEYL